MSISSVQIDPKAVTANIAATDKPAVMHILADMAAESYGMDSARVFEKLTMREHIGSTGFGNRIAIPHARFAELSDCVALVMRLEEAVPFDAHDGQAVDLIFCLLSPENSGARHLKALAEISRYLRDENHIIKLRGADSSDAMFVILSNTDARQAA